jgi:hypothetical protein
MDSNGARMLAARIRAGVRVGQSIELVRDHTSDPRLTRGDRGVVLGFDDIDGNLIVQWRAGFTDTLDPTQDVYQAVGLRAAS